MVPLCYGYYKCLYGLEYVFEHLVLHDGYNKEKKSVSLSWFETDHSFCYCFKSMNSPWIMQPTVDMNSSIKLTAFVD